jgi:gliding motility-associated-like protein
LIKRYKIFTIIAFLSFSNLGLTQLVTSTAQSPVQLVENVLVGGGVNISNVTYTGHEDAIGSFNGANTNLGLSSGIIMTTGTVLNTGTGGIFGGQEGPHGPNNTGSAGTNNGEPGYAPLAAISGPNEESYNAAILEFDFEPQSDSIRFRYVFGSEEYPEFVDDVNDVFAFFISGPGFGGEVNMALIPGTNQPITINTVNANVNTAYFIDNGDGSEAPQNGGDNYIQYDGFTVVLEASAQVQCGETYHLKIAISDIQDGAYDSGIFLEANSLDSQAPIEVTSSSTFNLPENKIAEGCEEGTVTITRNSGGVNGALVLPITVSGTATEGVDYGNIPSSVTFAPGQTSISFSFDIYGDGLVEGDETVKIEFDYPDPCGNSNLISADFKIIDVDPLVVTIPEQTVNCAGDEAVLTGVITGGIDQYSYTWSTGDNTQSITVSPEVTTDYTLSVVDLCVTTPVEGVGTVNVPVYPPATIVVTDDVIVLCPNTPQTLNAEASGGQGNFTYEWLNNGEVIAASSAVTVSPLETATYTVRVTDGCGTKSEENVLFTVTTPLLTIQMKEDQIVCPGGTANIWVKASGGLGDFTYYWYDNGSTDSIRTVQPPISTLYTVAVEDGCHTYFIDGETKVTIVRPYASFNVISSDPVEGEDVLFQNNSDAAVSWEWDFSNGETSVRYEPSTSYDTWGWQKVTLVATNEIGCKDTLYRMIYIKPEFYFYAPNAFTPDVDAINKTYAVSVTGAKEMEFYIYTRWGELIYQTTDIYFNWDGSYKGSTVQDGVLVYRAKVTDLENVVHELFGTITVLK